VKTEAVIFDMDGVISDTQKVHAETECMLFREYGITITPEENTKRFAGVPDPEAFEIIFREAGKPSPDFDTLILRKWELMFKISPERIAPIPGIFELVRNLRTRQIPLAVASSSRLDFIQLVLKSLGFSNDFTVLVSTDEVENGKPAPDIFLLAAARLHVSSAQCAVIEDGLSGMTAAKRAGMHCIGLLTHVSESESPADVNVRSLQDLKLDMLGIPAPKRM